MIPLPGMNMLIIFQQKISKNIGIIKRVRTFSPQHSLLTLYRALIEPYLRYCNTVWGQCRDTLKEKLQCLQTKVARAIAFQRYDEASHRNILSDFEWLNIRHLIDYDLGVLMYKTVNGHGPEICNLFTILAAYMSMPLGQL